jgi:hypothetical protein
MKRRLTIGILVAAAAALLAVEPALACPVCFGASDSPMATGVNNGILVLLGFVGAVQIGFVALFVSIRRRTRDYQDRKDSFSVINGGVQ